MHALHQAARDRGARAAAAISAVFPRFSAIVTAAVVGEVDPGWIT
jgi:hypothetical protein